MKYKIIATITILAILATPFILSQTVFADCGGVHTIIINCPDDATGTEAVCHILDDIVKILAVTIGIVAAIGIVLSGIQYLTANGNEEKVKKAKRRLLELVIGLAIYVPSAVIIDWLSPNGLVCGGIQIMGGNDQQSGN